MGKGKQLGLMLSAALMCVAMLASTAAAQNTNSSTTTQTGNGNNGGGSTARLSSSDRKFAMTAAAGGMAEVEMARLALTKASSDAVKQYAQKMIDDHTAANAELMQIASAKNLTLPTAPDAKHRAMMAKLEKLSGAAFDREYVMNAGHKDHQKMEKLFRDESTRGRDADLKAFATKTLPVVQEHLRLARDLHNQMMPGMKHSM
jgi:putative membrane protein